MQKNKEDTDKESIPSALGILVIGPEGAAIESLLKTKVVVTDILKALELFLNPKRLTATLRR